MNRIQKERTYTKHRERDEAAHRARVVIPRDADDGRVELAGNIRVRPLRALGRSPSVMVLVDRQKGLLVTNVQQARLVQIVQAVHERLRAAERRDQRRHVLRHEERIQPTTPLVRLVPVRVEIARREIQQRRAKCRILQPERAVQVSRLQKACKAGVRAIRQTRRLRSIVHILPIPRSSIILLRVRLVPQPRRHLRNAKIVIRILHRPTNTPRKRPHAIRIEIIRRNIPQRLPRRQPTTPLDGPVRGLVFGVRDDGFVGGGPVDGGAGARGDELEVGIREDDVGVGAALREAFAEGHAAVRQFAFVAVDVDEGAHHQGLGERVEEGD